MSRVYCAGPLFNESERTEMAAIAQVLEKAGHTTFLPHRDGFEYAQHSFNGSTWESFPELDDRRET